MNKISLLPMIILAGCVGLATGVNAQNDTSTQIGNVSSVCSIKASPGTLEPNTNLINGVNFPTELTSNNIPGKFSTLCNKASNTIQVQRLSSVSAPGDQGGAIVYSYALSATGTSAYIGNSILGTNITGTSVKTGSISHGFTQAASDLIVSAKAKVSNGFILGEGDYTISFKATITP